MKKLLFISLFLCFSFCAAKPKFVDITIQNAEPGILKIQPNESCIDEEYCDKCDYKIKSTIIGYNEKHSVLYDIRKSKKDNLFCCFKYQVKESENIEQFCWEMSNGNILYPKSTFLLSSNNKNFFLDPVIEDMSYDLQGNEKIAHISLYIKEK